MSAPVPALTIRAIHATGVEVPMTYALGTSRARLTSAPLLLIDLLTEEGVTGRAYHFCYLRAAAPAVAKIVEQVESAVKGDPVAPLDLSRKLATGFALIGVQGLVRMAMAGLDVAAWDAEPLPTKQKNFSRAGFAPSSCASAIRPRGRISRSCAPSATGSATESD
jgi:mandelate racemase